MAGPSRAVGRGQPGGIKRCVAVLLVASACGESAGPSEPTRGATRCARPTRWAAGRVQMRRCSQAMPRCRPTPRRRTTRTATSRRRHAPSMTLCPRPSVATLRAPRRTRARSVSLSIACTPTSPTAPAFASATTGPGNAPPAARRPRALRVDPAGRRPVLRRTPSMHANAIRPSFRRERPRRPEARWPRRAVRSSPGGPATSGRQHCPLSFDSTEPCSAGTDCVYRVGTAGWLNEPNVSCQCQAAGLRCVFEEPLSGGPVIVPGSGCGGFARGVAFWRPIASAGGGTQATPSSQRCICAGGPDPRWQCDAPIACPSNAPASTDPCAPNDAGMQCNYAGASPVDCACGFSGEWFCVPR